MYLTAPYELEIQNTAALLLANGVVLNSIIGLDIDTETWNAVSGNPVMPLSAFGPLNDYYLAVTPTANSDSVSVQTYQFGHPSFQVQNS